MSWHNGSPQILTMLRIHEACVPTIRVCRTNHRWTLFALSENKHIAALGTTFFLLEFNFKEVVCGVLEGSGIRVHGISLPDGCSTMLSTTRSYFQHLRHFQNRVVAVIVGLNKADTLFEIQIAYSLCGQCLQIWSRFPNVIDRFLCRQLEYQTSQKVFEYSLRYPFRKLRCQNERKSIVANLCN